MSKWTINKRLLTRKHPSVSISAAPADVILSSYLSVSKLILSLSVLFCLSCMLSWTVHDCKIGTILSLFNNNICLLSLHIPYFARSNVTHAIIQVVQIFSKYYRCYLDVRHFSSNKKNKNIWSNYLHFLTLSKVLTWLLRVFSKGTFIIILFNTEPAIKTIFNLMKTGFQRKAESFTMSLYTIKFSFER